MAKEEPQSEVSWEEAVAHYLEENPGFFDERPELLAQLELAHPGRGTAVSLIERQVGVLREQGQALQRQLRELISNARENEVIGQRLHGFACSLLQAGSLDEALDLVRGQIQEKFRLDAVALRLAASDVAVDRDELVRPNDEDLEALLRLAARGVPVCGVVLPDPLCASLFGAAADRIRSVVVVPLAGEASEGVLVLGSQDPHRFEAGMATDYLLRLGELARAAVERHL